MTSLYGDSVFRTYFSPTKWGDWTFDRAHLTLNWRGGHEIDLEALTTAEAVLEALAHARHKAYMPRKAVGALAEALIDLLNVNPTAAYGYHSKPKTPEQIRATALEQELQIRAARELRRREQDGPVPWVDTTGPLVSRDLWTFGEALDAQVEAFRRLRDGA